MDSREEPHLVSHAEVSLSLFALHTRIGFQRSGRGWGRGGRRGGQESRKDCQEFTPAPLPHPKQSPRSGSRIRYLPGAPGPSVTASPAGRALCGSRSSGRKKWLPGPAKSPSLLVLGEGGENGVSGSGGRAKGNLLILKKKKKKAVGGVRFRPGAEKAGQLSGGRGQESGGSGRGHPLPSPGPQRRRQLHTQKPIVASSRRSAPRTRPRGQARQRPRQPGRAP